MVEVLQVVSWPAVVLIVILVAMLVFRMQIINLLNRLRKLGMPGVALDIDPALTAVSNQSESKPAETGLAVRAALDIQVENRLQQARNLDVPPIVQEQQQLIRTDLRRLEVNQEEQVELLTKHLAVIQLQYRWEFTYRTIFGSQIALLKSLNLYGVGTRDQLFEFYKNANTQFPQLSVTYSFERYLQYLLNQGLIKAVDEHHYGVTVAGQEFLKWMVAASVSESKFF